jgi:ComF family protein
MIDRDQSICVDCLRSRFEPAEISNEEILPESVLFRLSLWSFDKYGYLQNLLHKLKYNHCTSIGEQLGREAGRLLLKSAIINSSGDWQLLAVPLHKKRHRMRGYNQSMEIAKGVAFSTKIPLLPKGIVSRRKHTKTQTGLNSSERTSNISGAFEITKESAFSAKSVLIIDDVYTTGATTFELAKSIHSVTGQHCGILTIAKA